MIEAEKTYPVPSYFSETSHLNEAGYQALYQRSIQDSEAFWAEQAETWIDWHKPWDQVLAGDFHTLDITWFKGAQLNACYNCLDRHLETRANQIAIIWEADEPGQGKTYTYVQLYEAVCRFANVLKAQGIQKGDRVCIYLPMIPEALIAMLACARIGAVHSVVFAGFSANALAARLSDAKAKLLVTADEAIRGGKATALKQYADEALEQCPMVTRMIVVKRSGKKIAWNTQRDRWFHEEMDKAEAHCPPVLLDSQDPLFILYTSGSTGQPKGVLHSVGGYMVHVATSFRYVFDYHESDIYWCTADVGWVTGHSYIVYGPLANGAISVMYEGTPFYPDPGRFWSIIDSHQVNIFYTAPTAIRALRGKGEQWLLQASLKSLKLLGSVGEPINPDVWEWYHRNVGQSRCPIVDTWWQTETGGAMIAPLPGAMALKPGSASRPFFGVLPEVVDEQGQGLPAGQTGNLVIKKPWPGMMKTIYGDHQRFIDNYFKAFPGCYVTGDSARVDEEGYFWILGRNDDVIQVSGHRLGTEEIESAFLSHPAVLEAAVVGIAHEIKGQGIYAFVHIMEGIEASEALKIELIHQVRKALGPIAQIETIQWARDLPKTRSGKMMRRLLRLIAEQEFERLGDTSTLANPESIQRLIADRRTLRA